MKVSLKIENKNEMEKNLNQGLLMIKILKCFNIFMYKLTVNDNLKKNFIFIMRKQIKRNYAKYKETKIIKKRIIIIKLKIQMNRNHRLNAVQIKTNIKKGKN